MSKEAFLLTFQLVYTQNSKYQHFYDDQTF